MRNDALIRLKSYFEDIFRDKTRLIRILLILFILAMALVLRIHEDSKADITVDNNADTAAADEICVDIGGAVVSPGVYTVSRDTRLYEVIEMAGGLMSSADTDSINRAAFVEDGEKIIIPVKPSALSVSDDTGDEPGAEPGAENSASDTQPEAALDSSSSSTGGLVNINYASREELMTLSGIGESKADKIIEYRSSTRFRKKEDIKSVNGIGDAIYNKIKDDITV